MTRLGLMLARRHLGTRRFRQATSVLGVALSMAMATAVVVSDRSIVQAYRELLDSVAGGAQLQVMPLSEGGVPGPYLERIAGSAEVADAAGEVASAGRLLAGDRGSPVVVFGLDPGAGMHRAAAVAGRLPAAGERRTVALGDALARDLGVVPGDRVSLDSGDRLVTLEVCGLVGRGGPFARRTLGRFAVLPLAAAQDLFRRGGALDRIDVALAEGVEVEHARVRLQELLGDLVRVETPRGQGRERERHLRNLEVLLALAAVIAGFAGLSVLVGNRALSLRERRLEIAILRLLGARRREVLGWLAIETAVPAAVGSALGVGAGVVLARLISGWAARDLLVALDLAAGRTAAPPALLAALLFGGFAATLLAALPPAMAALAEPPVLAARGEGPPGRPVPRSLAGAGAMIAGGAALLVALRLWPPDSSGAWAPVAAAGAGLALTTFGWLRLQPALLARLGVGAHFRSLLGLRFGLDSLARAPRRTATVALGLGLPLAMLVGIGGIARSQRATVDTWFERRIGWDFAVQAGSYALVGSQPDLPEAILDAVASTPGIAGVSRQKFGVVGIAGQRSTLWVLESDDVSWYSALALMRGDEEAALRRLSAGGAALVSPPLARRLGAGIGDRIALQTPTGAQRFEVVGLIEELGNPAGTVQIDWRDYRRAFGTRRFSQLVLRLRPGADPSAVREDLERRLARYPTAVLRSSGEFYGDVVAGVASFHRLLDGLVALALVTAALALANGLVLSVLDRRRVFALGRVGGMLRRQVAAALAWEGLLLGAWAAASGIGLGLAFAWASVRTASFTTGVTLGFWFPDTSVAVAALVALTLGPAAAVGPALRVASRLPLSLASER